MIETTQYLRTKRKILKKRVLEKEKIEKTLDLFSQNKNSKQLNFKKIICKVDKNRYSIRVVNTSFRIHMSIIDEKVYLRCICDHDDYQILNKNC